MYTEPCCGSTIFSCFFRPRAGTVTPAGLPVQTVPHQRVRWLGMAEAIPLSGPFGGLFGCDRLPAGRAFRIPASIWPLHHPAIRIGEDGLPVCGYPARWPPIAVIAALPGLENQPIKPEYAANQAHYKGNCNQQGVPAGFENWFIHRNLRSSRHDQENVAREWELVRMSRQPA